MHNTECNSLGENRLREKIQSNQPNPKPYSGTFHRPVPACCAWSMGINDAQGQMVHGLPVAITTGPYIALTALCSFP